MIAFVAFFGGAESGILSHGPQTTAVHVFAYTSFIGEASGGSIIAVIFVIDFVDFDAAAILFHDVRLIKKQFNFGADHLQSFFMGNFTAFLHFYDKGSEEIGLGGVFGQLLFGRFYEY